MQQSRYGSTTYTTQPIPHHRSTTSYAQQQQAIDLHEDNHSGDDHVKLLSLGQYDKVPLSRRQQLRAKAAMAPNADFIDHPLDAIEDFFTPAPFHNPNYLNETSGAFSLLR
ncbi:hypothetical protein T439DRAFT_27856 [Meredithblackwellia eburnea MCA 4105]